MKQNFGTKLVEIKKNYTIRSVGYIFYADTDIYMPVWQQELTIFCHMNNECNSKIAEKFILFAEL